MGEEQVGVMLVAGGGRLDVLCREVAAMGREWALLCDEHGPTGTVWIDGLGVDAESAGAA